MRIPILLLSAASVAFAFQAEDQPTGTIAGQVINQVTGAPLPDAIVKLKYKFGDANSETLVRQTNDAGRFSFTGIGAHNFELSTELHGFATAWYRASQFVPNGGFSLEKNQRLDGIVLKMVAQSVVTGKIFDADGKLVEGARVTLLKTRYADGVAYWKEAASAETLDNGEYRIPRVPAGHYVLKARLPPALEAERAPSEAAAEIGYMATYHPSVTDPSMAAPVDVVDGSEIGGIDIHLVRSNLFHIRGRLQPPTKDLGYLTLVDRTDRTVVASVRFGPPDGLFDFARVAPGSYLLLGRSNGTPFRRATSAVDLAGHDIEGVVLNLVREDYLPGKITPKPADRSVNLRNVSVLSDGLDLATATIGYGYQPAKIADDLTFRQSVPDQIAAFAGFRIRISKLPDGCYVDSIRYGGRNGPDSLFDYYPGDSLEIAIGTDGGRIDGTALGSDDRPHGGAVVALFPVSGHRSPVPLQTDGQGMFHFTDVPPGDYKIVAWDDVSRDDIENPLFVKRFDSQATAITLTAGGTAAVSVKLAAP
jgi:hypothetical protein